MVKKTERVSTRVTDKWTFSKAQPPPLKTTSRNSIYNRRSSSSTNVGQSAVNAQAKRSFTGTPSHFHSSGLSMENTNNLLPEDKTGLTTDFVHFLLAGDSCVNEKSYRKLKLTEA
ncbi:hypothetical protein POM88_048463 [Heracleum sosnowskyi]|uniref:Uncharacterized protein n=1 Tax=Heracleum sosnowskyi TaxID=360622 RepID=A0AAD8GTW4_9APIA|nr:hypothetical protein POM88_048463 [Heracleum sosnowskyi]